MTGQVVSFDGQDCATHSDLKATSVCTVCGKPVCNDCSVQLGSGIMCDDPSHKLIAQNWFLLYRVSSEFEADMIAKNLECHNIRTQVFSSRVFKMTLGENADDGVNVFVSNGNKLHALEILSSLQLANTVTTNEQLN